MLKLGIDIGSTTIKCVVLDDENKMLFSHYMRHHSDIQDTLSILVNRIYDGIGDKIVSVVITGSGGLALSNHLKFPFLQEVIAVSDAVKAYEPKTDVVVELGGEDAKIIYFDNDNVEQRMNGICAGGTGAFIDQMASLLKTDAKGLNEYAAKATHIYPIAARCGVFAKTDIQPLINDGASKEDLSASIFKAVVNQTISGLAQGRPIRGYVAFLGGPLHFLTELKRSFKESLNLDSEHSVEPENSHLFAAIGCAMHAGEESAVSLNELISRLNSRISLSNESKRLEPLFKDDEDYKEFKARHSKAVVTRADLNTYDGNLFLGIDAGSTTSKMALIGDNGELLWEFYSNNNGDPLRTCQNALLDLYRLIPAGLKLTRCCSTGYGENLIKAGLRLDDGEVETIAHFTGARFFDPDVDAIIDIGGQDMKCIRIKDKVVDSIQLNEACSSGCGSFIETFATSLGYDAIEFAGMAVKAQAPIDLGTRCTVFMNSKVKQAQKEGARVPDIAAGLAYSVIKNALYKVIKINSASDLGTNIVVQGGTFYNDAVLRAFEKITGGLVIRPDICGIMGAFGAALIARDNHREIKNEVSSIMSYQELEVFDYKTTMTHCHGCVNKCALTIATFSDGSKYISGNRCERGLGKKKEHVDIPNLFDDKLKLLFDRATLDKESAKRGTVGIPRVLNMYENYPFWATFFRELGYGVVLSPLSDKKIYEMGITSIPSESECYPAKLVHGHIEWLIKSDVDFIFYPCVPYERKETPEAANHFNCPIVTSYPENINNNIESLNGSDIRIIHPFISFESPESLFIGLKDVFCNEDHKINESELFEAISAGWMEQQKFTEEVQRLGEEALKYMTYHKLHGIILAGRPYHLDPEINHGIPQILNSYGVVVFTEDSIAHLGEVKRPIGVLDQWMYHSRLYKAASFAATRNDIDLIQLNSFGCGLDAVTTDEVSDILTSAGKIYTLLKIDEISNLGASRIRIRSLLSAIKMKERERGYDSIINKTHSTYDKTPVYFTQKMKDDGYTILCPQMSPIHFDFLEPAFKSCGYNLVVLNNDTRSAVDTGLKYVNNDACYPSLIVVGQLMKAVLSGEYDTDRLALIITQTGGGCRASNYISFIRRALAKAGYSNIPVISLNLSGLDEHPGFKISAKLVYRGMYACIIGDLLMRVLYATRPYERIPGSADKVYDKWKRRGIDLISGKRITRKDFAAFCNGVVHDFDRLKLVKTVKPKVGVVGEILVKYSPLANNDLVKVLEKEGAQVISPDLIDFLLYCFYNNKYKNEEYGMNPRTKFLSLRAIQLLEYLRKPMKKALKNSRRFDSPEPITHKNALANKVVSTGNQCGEGWFLTGEMIELLEKGVNNIICVQPFGCLPNHIVGKGVVKKIRSLYPEANIVAVDYDPGASEVNQLNRIKLMMTSARRVASQKANEVLKAKHEETMLNDNVKSVLKKYSR